MITNKTINTYNHIAASYAARTSYPLERELDRFSEMMPTGGLALDVGCGPGQYARALGARGLHVVALDLSRGMLRQAQIDETPRLVRADMLRLPVESELAAGCFVCASLLHLPRSQSPRALAEFRRVLRPGGALYVSIKQGREEKWVTGQQGHERFFGYYQPGEFDPLIRAAGFEIVDGWLSPPGKDQRHNWINRFAIARSK